MNCTLYYAGAYVQCRSGQTLVEMLDPPTRLDAATRDTPTTLGLYHQSLKINIA